MNSSIGKLDAKDAIRGAITAILGAITSSLLLLLQKMMSSGDFRVTSQDLILVAAGGLVAGLSYLQKRFWSDEQGQVLGSSKL